MLLGCHIGVWRYPLGLIKKKIRRTMSGNPAGHASTSQIPDPVSRTETDAEVTPDCPSIEDSDNVSVTNSEVEGAMNHWRRRAALHDPDFSEEAFNDFNSGDAYIRAARDGLTRATDQYLKDMRVSTHLYNSNNYIPVAPDT